MKKVLLTFLLSALILPVMADTSKDLEAILANKKLAGEINSTLKNIKEQKTPSLFYQPKADTALQILIKENPDLKPLLDKVLYSRNNLINFLANTEYKGEADFKQTCKDLFYYLDALALDIWEIGKADKALAKTTEEIVNHQYYFKALALDANISAMLTLIQKYYKPAFYDNMAIAQSDLIKQNSKTGYNKEWETFIDNWLKKHNK